MGWVFRCVKRRLRKVLGDARLPRRFVYHVNRSGRDLELPSTYEFDEVGKEVLTPSHLIFRRRIETIPDEIVEGEEDESRYTLRFTYLSVRLTHFWNRWSREYMANLRK